MARLLIFDIDGTLVDSQDMIVEAQRRTFAAHGLAPPDRRRSLSIVGLSLHEAFAALAGPEAPIESLAEHYKGMFHELRADGRLEAPFYPGAREAVARFAARDDLLLGVASGKSRRGVAHLFERAGWGSLFATVQTADDHPSKPAPDMIFAALAETGTAPGEAIMIGDTSFDMQMAVAAGVRAVGVAWGYHEPGALLAAGAERVIENFAELDALLDKSLPSPRKTGERVRVRGRAAQLTLPPTPALSPPSGEREFNSAPKANMSDDLSSAFFVAPGERDPLRTVKEEGRRKLPKRFYTEAMAAPSETAFAILLDGKPVRTPAGGSLVLPTAAAAELVAAEWRAQGEFIDPSTMPVTRLVNSALDGVARDMAGVAADIVKYSGSDLVCYRAGEPEGLVAAQAAAWDPALVFARENFGARFILSEGVMFVQQPAEAVASFAKAVERLAQSPLKLAALHSMTSLTGSALLAIMVADGALSADAAWAAAHVDEDFQMARWGADSEALIRRAQRFADMKAAADLWAALSA